MNERRQALIALSASTIAFTVCFAVWVINAVLVTYLVSARVFLFSETEVGWLLAAPILTGALSRVPLGMLTDRYGGRIVFTLLMVGVSLPLYLLSFADTFAEFFLLSLAFGIAGGSFAVGCGYVSVWFPKDWQGTALGIFGIGNAGAAATTILAPQLLQWLTDHGADLDGWRSLPRMYAGFLLVSAVLFYLIARPRVAPGAGSQGLGEQIKTLRDIVVWRLGLYYFLVFGSFVALAQWIVPYAVNVYELSIAQAGLLAAVFSLPSGIIRALGGWMSDYFGARTVMNWVFWSCAVACLILAVPKMDILSPGPGVTATEPGAVSSVAEDRIVVGEKTYLVIPPPARTPADSDDGTLFLPQTATWQEPVVEAGESVQPKTLLARGVTNIYYPASIWVFALLVFIFGLATGVGKAGVYRLIPDQFPGAVGTVGGMVGLIGALGGSVFALAFSYLLDWTGVWASCWLVLALLSLACLIWKHEAFRRIMRAEAPDLAELLERRPMHASVASPSSNRADNPRLTAKLRQSVLLFRDLNEEALEKLVEIGEERSLPPQFELFRTGDPGDALYCILEGKVSLRVEDEGRHPIDLGVRQEGDTVGELALIDGGPRSATVTTLESCRLFAIERRGFLEVLTKSPNLLANLLVVLTGKIRTETTRFLEAALDQEKLKTQQEIGRRRSMSQMVAGVAHEINTPLGIANHAASIISDLLSTLAVEVEQTLTKRAALEDVLEACRLMQDNIRRADRLVQTFKTLAVSQALDNIETVDLRRLTQDVVELFSLTARSSRLAIRVVDELGPGSDRWEGYPGHYTQVLLNLLTNIDRYAYPDGTGGKVEIVLGVLDRSGGDERYSVVVRDFGRGIAPEHLEHVFEPFYTTGRMIGGTGLGLAIVKNLVTESLQGEIRIASRPGEGTEVFLSLPRVAAPIESITP